MRTLTVFIKRILQLELPKKQSAFLWGARKTGKSTFLKKNFPDSIRYNLLESETYLRLLSQPHLLREEILALSKKEISQPIIIDEVQKIPLLLNEIHWLIEETDAQFILCGSSARKLKRGAANLLGGRAWRYHFFPFTYHEIKNFNLLIALNHGLIPSHYLSDHPNRVLTSYIHDYLNEEIKEEGIARNLPAFSRFLESVAFTNNELVNYTNIAQDVGIDKNTVKEYFQILVDTLIGYFIYPYKDRSKRDSISATPKFYLFDTGVANFLSKTEIKTLKGISAGKSFEQFILMELMAYKELNSFNFDVSYWRNKSGLEVDFILGKASTAIEVKISDNPKASELKGIIKFKEQYPECDAYVVANVPRKRRINVDDTNYITIIPWQEFLEKLWGNHLTI